MANDTWRLGQPQRIGSFSDLELMDFIHADGIFHVPRATSPRCPHLRVESSRNGNTRTQVTHTPDGGLVERWTLDPTTGSWHPTEFPVKTREDIGRLRWVYTGRVIEADPQQLSSARALVKEVGDRGITKVAWGTSPLMDLVQHVCGPIRVQYFLVDYPEEMDELIELMHAANLALVRQLAELTPADVIVSVENTSTTLIGPGQFERYCYRHLCDYGRAVVQAGKMHELHMCGHLGVLLEKIDSIPAAAIEAFTSPPLGNTRLLDGRTRAASKTLIGGTCVNVWLEPAEVIQAYILGELDACPDHRHIVLTTAGVAPPACPAEVFRAVGEWIPSVPIRA